MDFEKFIQLASQVKGTLSSRQCVTANLLSFIAVIFFREHITSVYAKLNGMDNPIINVATWGLLFSGYIIIYKAVSAVFNAVSKYRKAVNDQKEDLRRKEIIKQSLLALSRQEIAILKFMLAQESCSAWLPDKALPVIRLEAQNIITNINLLQSKTVEGWQGTVYGVSCNAYTISEDIQIIFSQISQELSVKWKTIQPDNSLARFQDNNS